MMAFTTTHAYTHYDFRALRDIVCLTPLFANRLACSHCCGFESCWLVHVSSVAGDGSVHQVNAVPGVCVYPS